MSTIPTTQKALVIPESGGQYTLTTRPTSRPGPGNVLVKIEAIGLNPVEVAIQNYGFEGFATAWGISHFYPLLAGVDGAGTIVEVGQGVKGFANGDRVTFEGWYHPGDMSTFQEYTIAPADLIAKIPSSMSLLEAASIPLALVTAAFGMCLPYVTAPERGGLGLKPFWEDGAEGHHKGQPIIVLGGSTSVGQYAIQIARYLGFSSIITTSSTKHAEYLQGLGATHVVDRNASDVPAQIKTILGGKDVKYIYDAVHPIVTQTEVDLLAPGGIILTVRQPGNDLQLKDGRQVALVLGAVHKFKDAGRALFAKLPEFLERGVIKPNRVEKVPGGLKGIVDGLKRLEANQVSGCKLVVVPSETPEVV